MKAAIAEISQPPSEDDPDFAEKNEKFVERPHLKLISDMLIGNIGMIFTNGDLGQIKDILDTQVRAAPARVGSIAPSDVVVPAGPTGLDPKQTEFFQALSIPTKIVKAQIEIVNDVQIIQEGEKVGNSQAALLDKLKIMPFEYKMHIQKVLDNGRIFDAAVLSISEEDILSSFGKAASNVTAASLGSGYVIGSAAPHLIMNAFKNLAAVSFASDYDFPQAEALKNAAANAPAASSGPAAAAVEEKVEEKEESEEEADVDMGDLFGGDY